MNWRDIPSLSALRAFEATARTGSFTKAAAELNVTHAAIAQHVRGLEKQFALQLVERSGKGMALTADGAQFANRLRDGFLHIAAAVDDLNMAGRERPVRVTMTPSFAANWLMPRIGAFWAGHPDIQVDLSPSIELIDLARDGFDLAIRFGDGQWPDLDCTPLTSGRFVAVAHPDLLKGRQVSCLADVADLPFVLDSYIQEHVTLLESNGVSLDDLDIKSLNTTALVDAALFAGAGVCIRNYAFFRNDIAKGRLALVCELQDQGLSYFVVHPKDKLTDAAKVFKSWLLNAERSVQTL